MTSESNVFLVQTYLHGHHASVFENWLKPFPVNGSVIMRMDDLSVLAATLFFIHEPSGSIEKYFQYYMKTPLVSTGG